MIDTVEQGLAWSPARKTIWTLCTTKTQCTLLLLVFIFVLPGTNLGPTLTQLGAASAIPGSALIDSGSPQQDSPQVPEQQEQGLSQKAVEITRLFGFPITNSMIVSWIVALSLIILGQMATRNMKQVPEGAQNFLEWLVEGLYRFIEGILGPHLAKRTFWFFVTIFLFILSANWVGLIPGVGSIGWGQQTSHGFKIDQPLFRSANADVNMTFAMALVFFVCWFVWALQEVGPFGFLKELFGPEGKSTGLLKLLMIVVFFAAGCLEIISILFRPMSLSFRLYGNICAGENLLEAMATLVPGFSWLHRVRVDSIDSKQVFGRRAGLALVPSDPQTQSRRRDHGTPPRCPTLLSIV